VHAQARTAAATDWPQIARLYEQLLEIRPSPVIALNHAVAVSMCQGAEAGLASLDALLASHDLADYYPAHVARADLSFRLGKVDEARTHYERALALVRQEPVRRFLARRLQELQR
jgi:RNA polymerase sigma-70 factor (ECF subfamily)